MVKQVTKRRAKRLTVVSRQRPWDSDGFAQVVVQYVLSRLAVQEQLADQSAATPSEESA